MEQAELERRAGWKKSPVLGILASIVLVGAILAVLYALGIHERVVELLQWFEAQGAWAPVLFIVIMMLVMVLLLPGVLFTTGAGFVFGVLEGTVYVVGGTVLGAAASFLIARHLFGERAKEFIMARAKLKLMSDELTPHGWKIVLLTRLIPFFPSKISNYFFGLTHFSLGGFVVGSTIGFIPFSLHNVYLGSLAADLTTLGVRETGRSPLEWAIYGAGFVGTVIAVIFLNRLARRALAKYTGKDEIVEDVS
ncbi:TVP38/TMEM64 family protein [Marinobacter fonticola]|uniref:TVP38/TMEM64 family protein n=1 Tax=Marinobacter fonticola TaxID=2603215 RepID=UPI0011E6FB25|nr:TVP38/TMEM64 family protein [Marinobacter fonticola]